MHREGRYAQLSTRAVCIPDSTVHGKQSTTTAALPVTSEQVVAGSPRPPAPLDRLSSALAPRPAPGTSWSEQAPVLAPLLKPGHGDMDTSALECKAPRPPSVNYTALTNGPSEIKPLRRMVSSSEWSKSQQQQQCACVPAGTPSLTNHKVYYLKIERAPPRHQLPSNLALPFDFHFS